MGPVEAPGGRGGVDRVDRVDRIVSTNVNLV